MPLTGNESSNIVSKRNYFLLKDELTNFLRNLPGNSILFADRADELEFSMAYGLYAESKRQDMTFIDCNAGVSKSIYGDKYYKIWGKPRLKIRETVETGIIDKTNRPVYYGTHDPKQIDIPRIKEGLLYKTTLKSASKIPKTIPWDEFFVFRNVLRHNSGRSSHVLMSHYNSLGEYYLENNRPDQAIGSYKTIELLGGGEWRLILAAWYFKNKDYKSAELLYKEHIIEEPDSAEAINNIGVIYLNTGRHVEAEEYFKKAVKADAYYAEAHYNLGVIYWKQKRWQDVIREFSITLNLNPKHSSAARYLDKARKIMDRYQGDSYNP